MQESILSLLKYRDKKLAEKSTNNFDIKKEIEEIEVIEAKDINIKKEEDENNIEKTKGELFAEKLRRQFIGSDELEKKTSNSNDTSSHLSDENMQLVTARMNVPTCNYGPDCKCSPAVKEDETEKDEPKVPSVSKLPTANTFFDMCLKVDFNDRQSNFIQLLSAEEEDEWKDQVENENITETSEKQNITATEETKKDSQVILVDNGYEESIKASEVSAEEKVKDKEEDEEVILHKNEIEEIIGIKKNSDATLVTEEVDIKTEVHSDLFDKISENTEASFVSLCNPSRKRVILKTKKL